MIQQLSIRDLSNLSGIKPHTIRMWEKRYSIFDPDRTETNIRAYSHQDLKKLLNISTLLEHGMKISRASSLSEEELKEEIESLSSENESNAIAFLVNKMILATLRCDVFDFNQTYESMVEEIGLQSTIEKVIYPLLVRIGTMWSIDRMYPAQEHFASQMLRQKLYSAVDRAPVKKSNMRFMCYLPDEEMHEIGLLYAHYLIRSAGHESVYLGPNVPLEGIAECAAVNTPSHMLCLFTGQQSDEAIDMYLDKMRRAFPKQEVLIGGSVQAHLDKIERLGFTYLEDIPSLKKLL